MFHQAHFSVKSNHGPQHSPTLLIYFYLIFQGRIFPTIKFILFNVVIATCR